MRHTFRNEGKKKSNWKKIELHSKEIHAKLMKQRSIYLVKGVSEQYIQNYSNYMNTKKVADMPVLCNGSGLETKYGGKKNFSYQFSEKRTLIPLKRFIN